MIGHEGESVDPDEVTLSEAVKALEVDEALDIAGEDVLPVVTALVDVIDLATTPIPAAGSGFELLFLAHVDKSFEEGKILIYFRIIFRKAKTAPGRLFDNDLSKVA